MQAPFIPIPQEVTQAEILLINPDFSKTELGGVAMHENHLGLNRLASYLDAKEISVQVLNTTGRIKGSSGPEELGKWLNSNHQKYQVLGFYTTSWNIAHLVRIIKELSAQLLDKPVFFGGPLASAEPQKTIEYLASFGLKNIGLVQGYGEFLLEKMLAKKGCLAEVEGAWSWQNGEIAKGSLQSFSEEEIASLPLLNPKYNTYYQLYLKDCLANLDLGEMSLEMIFGSLGLDSNQGCPFNCSYCSIPFMGRKVGLRSPKRVVDEVEYTAKETGIFMYTFTYSNVMFYTRQWIREFCEEILQRKMNHYLSWNGYHHLNVLEQLSVADFQLMKEAGSDEIVIGVQSIEEEICEYFNRPKNTFQMVKTLVKKLEQTGQRLVVDYITSVPGEKAEKIMEFYNYCQEHNIECRSFDLKLYPATEISSKPIDLTHHDAVPITGDIPPELGAYLLVNKEPVQELSQAHLQLHSFNQKLNQSRPIRLGRYQVTSKRKAEELMHDIIPQNEAIPNQVKRAMIIVLKELLSPQKRDDEPQKDDLESMLKQLANMGESAPPVLQKLKEMMIAKMGEAQFESLIAQYKEKENK